MTSQTTKTATAARSPHNDDSFDFKETPSGRRVALQTVCEWAGVACIISSSAPLDIRIHSGTDDFIAAQPGLQAYCLASCHMPKSKAEAGHYILERLAYGAYEWSSREILQADHRRRKRQADRIVQQAIKLATRQAALRLDRQSK